MERAKDPFRECREKFTPTFALSCLFWLPAQSINFMWVPSKYRVTYVGLCALVWVNILCWLKRQNYSTSIEQLPIATIVECEDNKAL